MIDLARTGNPETLRLLERHPKIIRVEQITSDVIEFHQGAWKRGVDIGVSAADYGLVEMIDNNPLVCVDRMSIPTPVGILASIAVGPLIDAGLVVDPPAILSSIADDSFSVDDVLRRIGWPNGAILETEERSLEGVVAVNVIVAIKTPDRLEDLDDLYEERFGRSFFIRRDEEHDWDVTIAKGSQNAFYRLRIAADEPHSLLTIQTMADRNGKCGAGALVHAMNVMAGFEESLGLA